MSFLDDLKSTAESTVNAIGAAVGGGISTKINQEIGRVTGTNTPVAGTPQSPFPSIPSLDAGKFFSGNVAGISVPLILAAVLGVYLISRKR